MTARKSYQEVWITLRICSQLDIETDAPTLAHDIAERLQDGRRLTAEQFQFLLDAHRIDVVEVEEEADIYETGET